MDLEEQYDRIYRYCCFRLHNTQTAEDITQETFLRFFNKELSLDGDRELPYLYRVARNLCIDEYRKGSRETPLESEESAGCDPSEDWINSIAVKAVIEQLPKDEQEFLLLRYANEVPVSHICKITGLSRFAVYRKEARILKFLKAELQKGGGVQVNKKLKSEIAKAFEVSAPSEKARFIRSLPRRRISTRAFILRQAAFIKPSVWLLSLLILLPAVGCAWFAGKDTIWIAASFVPFLAMLLITESTKSAVYGMNELEMSACFSLKSVILARLCILGVFDFVLFTVLIGICCLFSGIPLLLTGIYLFVPYLLTTNISLYLARRFRGKEIIYWCMAAAVTVSGTNAALRFLAGFLYQTAYQGLWAAAAVLLLAALLRELHRTFRKTEGFVWNFALTD